MRFIFHQNQSIDRVKYSHFLFDSFVSLFFFKWGGGNQTIFHAWQHVFVLSKLSRLAHISVCLSRRWWIEMGRNAAALDFLLNIQLQRTLLVGFLCYFVYFFVLFSLIAEWMWKSFSHLMRLIILQITFRTGAICRLVFFFPSRNNCVSACIPYIRVIKSTKLNSIQ